MSKFKKIENIINLISKSDLILIALVFVLAFSIRFLLITQANDLVLQPDAVEYDRFALSLLSGKGFTNEIGQPTSFRPPLYPFMLSVIYWLAGHSYFAVRVVQAVISSLTCIIIFLIAKLLINRTVGLISAIILSLYMSSVYLTIRLLSESVFVLFFSLSILCFLKGRKNLTLKWPIFVGAFLGLAALTRPIVLLFPLVLFVSLIIDKKDKLAKKPNLLASKLKHFLIMFFSFIIVLTPWTIRNFKVHNAFVPISTDGGITLYSCYTFGDVKNLGNVIHDNTTAYANKINSEVERSNFLVKETLKLIRKKPKLFFKLMVLKAVYFFNPFDWAVLEGKTYNFHWGIILILGIIGMFLLFDKWREFSFLHLVILYFFVLALVFWGTARFRYPADPYFIIFAAFTVYSFFRRYSNKLFPFFVLSSLFFINYLFYLNSEITKDTLKKIFQWLM